MHAGGPQILNYYERFRFKKNVYLDLSYTAQHYMNKSLFGDLLYVAKNFDKKIVIGSDYPSKSLNNLTNAVSKLSNNISKKKMFNICYKNLKKIFDEIQR